MDGSLLACMVAVAALNQLPPRVLPAIAVVEGGRAGQAVRNLDGSEDLGPMQVNTRWLPAIATAMGGSVVQARARLLGDTCFNISAGGAILRTYLQETRGDLMGAIGDYHSHTPFRNLEYRGLVLHAAWRLYGPRAAAPMHRITFTPVMLAPARRPAGR